MIVQVRSAQPTADLNRVKVFYGKTLGLREIGAFDAHEGYSGVMYAFPDAGFHIEFTQEERGRPLPDWSAESLLVLYVPDQLHYHEMVTSLDNAGAERVPSQNPYWDRRGATFLDPDGRRVVIFQSDGL
ncbi:MAG: VOC family protein [Candidatus Eremiobacteraeota bacterium]|nr:VOC family protein [Candidatus Eremiobacteraeota bacterium]